MHWPERDISPLMRISVFFFIHLVNCMCQDIVTGSDRNWHRLSVFYEPSYHTYSIVLFGFKFASILKVSVELIQNKFSCEVGIGSSQMLDKA